MDILTKLLAAGLLFWLTALMALVFVRMARGDITSRGFLSGNPRRAGKETQPERAVAMLVAPLVLGLYLVSALNIDVSAVAPGTRPSLPDIPDYLMTLLTGSNGLYLAGKIARGSRGVLP